MWRRLRFHLPTFYPWSVALSTFFLVCQEAGKKANKMPLSCATRWSSHYNQALFASTYKLQIESALEYAKSFPKGPDITYTERDWVNTSAIVRLLKLMRDTVTVLQGNFITNSMMPMLSSMLHVFIMDKATADLPDHILGATMEMFNSFGDRFEESTDASKIAAFLDPRSKHLSWTDTCEKAAFRRLVVEATFDMATREAAERADGKETSADATVASASTQAVGTGSRSSDATVEPLGEGALVLAVMMNASILTADASNEGPTGASEDDAAAAVTRRSLAEFEVSRFEGEKAVPTLSSTQQVLEWWIERRMVFPTLYRVACVYLAVPATSGSSERVFSDAGNIITKKRNRLSPENANNLVFLHGCHGVGWQLGEDEALAAKKMKM